MYSSPCIFLAFWIKLFVTTTKSFNFVLNILKLSEQYKDIWETIPASVLSVKMTDLKKSYKNILETSIIYSNYSLVGGLFL